MNHEFQTREDSRELTPAEPDEVYFVSKIGIGAEPPLYTLPGQGGIIQGEYGELHLTAEGAYSYYTNEGAVIPENAVEHFSYRLVNGPGEVVGIDGITIVDESLEELLLTDRQGFQHFFAVEKFVPGMIFHSPMETEVEFDSEVSSAVLIEFEKEPGKNNILRVEISNDGVNWTDAQLKSGDFRSVADSSHYTASGSPPVAAAVNGESVGLDTFRYIRVVRSAGQDIDSVYFAALITQWEDHLLEIIPCEESEPEWRVTSVAAGQEVPDFCEGTVDMPVEGLYGAIVVNSEGTWNYSLLEDKASGLSGARDPVDIFTCVIEDGCGGRAFQELQIPVELPASQQEEQVRKRIAETFVSSCEAEPWKTFQMDEGTESSVCSTLAVPMVKINGIPPFVVGEMPGMSVPVLASVSLRCREGAKIKKASVEITDHNTEIDELSIDPAYSGGLVISIESGGGVASIQGPGTAAQFEQALRAVRYTGKQSDNSGENARLTVQVQDQNNVFTIADFEVTGSCDLSEMMGIFEVLESSTLFVGSEVRQSPESGAFTLVPFVAGHSGSGAKIDLSLRDQVGNLVASGVTYADGAGNWATAIDCPLQGAPCAIEMSATPLTWEGDSPAAGDVLVADLDDTFLQMPQCGSCRNGDLIGSILDARPLRNLAFQWG